MNCFDIQEKIIDLVLGELANEDELFIREHLETCPLCREEFHFFSECLHTCEIEKTETCECQFQETYWNDFVVSVHEQIKHEKREPKVPFHIVVPTTVVTIAALGIGYLLFFRPSPQETAQEETTPYYEYDPYREVDELSPEEAEEFIRIINQRYGE